MLSLAVVRGQTVTRMSPSSDYRISEEKGGKKDYELSRKRETSYLAAIPKDLSQIDLSQVRICSRHFIAGKPASFYDTLNPDYQIKILLHPATTLECYSDRLDTLGKRPENPIDVLPVIMQSHQHNYVVER